MFDFIKRLFKKDYGPKFKVGQKIKCIDDRNHVISFGKTYTVLAVTKTTCCKVYCYDVGIGCVVDRYTSCCSGKIQGRGIHWCGEFRFAPMTEDEIEAESTEEVSDEVGNEIMTEVKKILETEHCMN